MSSESAASKYNSRRQFLENCLVFSLAGRTSVPSQLSFPLRKDPACMPYTFRGGEIAHSVGNFVAGPIYHRLLMTPRLKHFNRPVRSHWSELAGQ